MNTLLSVIVPVYNASQYLVACLESILCQTYQNLEIILVDDASSDNSGEICEKFSREDERVKVFHVEHQGSVAARRFGIAASNGKLITFVDADDWIETDMYQSMMEKYTECEPDFISSGLNCDDGEKTTREIDHVPQGCYGRRFIETDIIPHMMYDEQISKRGITPSLCTKIIRRELLENVVKNQDSNITYGDDASVAYFCLAQAQKVYVFERCWYHYRVHSGSQVRTYGIDSFQKIAAFENNMKEGFKRIDLWEQMENQVKQYTKTFLIPAIQSIYGIDMSEVYLFPFELVEKNSSIVIYGAGGVGKSYVKNIQCSDFVKMVAWIDKYSRSDDRIQGINALKSYDYDYIVIAVKNKEMVDEIKNELMGMQIPENEIIWKEPRELN